MANKVVKTIKKAAKDVANEGKHQIHHIERNISSKKVKKQKSSQKQKAVKLLNKGIKDLSCYKDRQGVVGEVANDVIGDIKNIIEQSHGNNKNELLLDLCKALLEKTSEENQLHSTSEMVQTRKLEDSELKKIYSITNDIGMAFCEMLE